MTSDSGIVEEPAVDMMLADDGAGVDDTSWLASMGVGVPADSGQKHLSTAAAGDAGSLASTGGGGKPKKSEVLGMKKPSNKFKCQCRGCSLWFEQLASGTSFDHACKNKMDNISRIAKAQGKLDWYHQVRGNDIKLQQVLVEYSLRVSNSKQRQPRGITMQYMEQVVASTSVIVEEIGILMYERQYIVFAESIEGGRMTEVQAKQQWASWLQQRADSGGEWPPADMKGMSGERRIWVKTQDLMKFQSKLERAKKMTAADKPIQNASEEGQPKHV